MNENPERKPLWGGKKRIIVPILGLTLGAGLLLLGSVTSDDSGGTATEGSRGDEMYYSEIVERKLEDFLGTVGGIGAVNVFVTVDGSTEYEYAGKGGGDGYASDYLVIDGGAGEEAAVVREIYPKIRGVAVTCTGGDSAAVRERITTLLSAALGIPANKIEVAGNG